MTYTSELNYNELPKNIYSWLIDEHKKSWTYFSIDQELVIGTRGN